MIAHPCDDPAALATQLRAMGPFAALHKRELNELVTRMSLIHLDDGDILVAQDHVSEDLFIVMDGALTVTTTGDDGVPHTLQPMGTGDLVGGMNIFSGTGAPATIRASGTAQIAALSKDAFARFCAACPCGELSLLEALRPQLHRHRLRMALHASEMFGEVEHAALAELETEFELVSLYGGEALFHQGDPGDSLYIVVGGRLRVVTAGAGGTEILLAELGSGETVGEMAIISGEPRSATVYAARDSQLAKLSRKSIERVIERHPSSMLRMLTGRLVARLRNASSGERRPPVVSTVAVVPAAPDVPLTEFSSRLATALSQMGPALHLTSARVDMRCGRAGAAQAAARDGGGTGLLEWLVEQELKHRYVVYEADPGLTPWTERSVRQADRIVLVAHGTGNPAPGEIEIEVLTPARTQRTPVTLALLHPDTAAAPSGTARWLAGRTLERHLHVRRTNAADYGRLARFVTGNAIGLTLGGGFARGLAHLGVLRAMQELNIPVDMIGGASMGAMVGAQWVLGWDAKRIVHEMSTTFAESFDDMTIPFLAFKRGGKASRLVRRFFDSVRIEDMWLPYFCVSANLNRSELKVHTSGPLGDAVLASSRAPGIFPPLVLEGELHVDGGLINNVPVDVMKVLSGGGIVIGVDVSPPHELNPVRNYGDDVSGWTAIWRRFHPTREKRVYHPSLLLVLLRIIEFGGISYRREKAAMADLYIAPDVHRFKRNDFGVADAIVETGYGASHEAVRQWLASAPPDLRRRRPDLFRA